MERRKKMTENAISGADNLRGTPSPERSELRRKQNPPAAAPTQSDIFAIPGVKKPHITHKIIPVRLAPATNTANENAIGSIMTVFLQLSPARDNSRTHFPQLRTAFSPKIAGRNRRRYP